MVGSIQRLRWSQPQPRKFDPGKEPSVGRAVAGFFLCWTHLWGCWMGDLGFLGRQSPLELGILNFCGIDERSFLFKYLNRVWAQTIGLSAKKNIPVPIFCGQIKFHRNTPQNFCLYTKNSCSDLSKLAKLFFFTSKFLTRPAINFCVTLHSAIRLKSGIKSNAKLSSIPNAVKKS
jgi:hypothetical protein